MFGGYSWREQQFRIWQLVYRPQIDAFGFRPVSNWPGQDGIKVIAFAGDEIRDARARLVALLRQRGKLQSGSLNMEPFEVLRDMIRSLAFPTIGGAPQVAKVYRYLRTQYFSVRWPTGQGVPHVLGRPALKYEQFEAPSIDPDAPEIQARWQIIRREQAVADISSLADNYDTGFDLDWPNDNDYER